MAIKSPNPAVIEELLKRSWFKVVRRENTPLWESLIQAGGALSNKKIGFENPMKELLALDYDKYAATDDFQTLKAQFIALCKKDPHFLSKFFSHLEKECADFDAFVQANEKKDWESVVDVDLAKIYEGFVDYSLKILTFLWPPLAPEEWIVARISDEVAKHVDPAKEFAAHQEAVHILIASATPSLLQEREEAIVELAARIGTAKDLPKFEQEIAALHEKYAWINDHSLKFERESREHFDADLNTALKEDPKARWEEIALEKKENERKRKELIARLDLPKDIVSYAEQASLLPHWRLLRTEKSVEAAHRLIGMFEEIERRMNVDDVLLCYYWEVSRLLAGDPMGARTLEAREDGYGLIVRGERAYDLTVEERTAMKEAIERTIEHAKTVKGNVACRGLVRGKVRVLIDTKKLSSFADGEVLVTSMTTPEYVSIMKKAAAIVTDEGGISCHAAIVSRELKVPCIIGTKNATKVLKTGDMVEVDANKGIVKIL